MRGKTGYRHKQHQCMIQKSRKVDEIKRKKRKSDLVHEAVQLHPPMNTKRHAEVFFLFWQKSCYISKNKKDEIENVDEMQRKERETHTHREWERGRFAGIATDKWRWLKGIRLFSSRLLTAYYYALFLPRLPNVLFPAAQNGSYHDDVLCMREPLKNKLREGGRS